MARLSVWFAALFGGLCLGLAACSALTPAADGSAPPALRAADEIARATGNPLLLGIVGVAQIAYARWQAKRAVSQNEAQDWTDADADAMAEKMRARGWKVERVS